MIPEDAKLMEELLKRARDAKERSNIIMPFKNADYWRIQIGRPLSTEEKRIARALEK